MTQKNIVLMNSLYSFFQIPAHIQILLSILRGESKISLRVVDWFVTNYSKKKNITYLISEHDGRIIFDEDDERMKQPYRQFVVYLHYKLQLKGYQKKQFDPFCRRQRIDFYYDNDNSIQTTVGQLNFFRWAITNNIIEYIDQHLKVIETDMNTCYKMAYKKQTRVKGSQDNREEAEAQEDDSSETAYPMSSSSSSVSTSSGSASCSSSSSRRKRQELSASASKTIHKSHIKVLVTFD